MIPDSAWHSLSQDGFWARFWGFLLRVVHYPFTFFFEIPFFMNIILILFCLLPLSFIVKGLAMCRLGGGGGGGGVIITQIVLF